MFFATPEQKASVDMYAKYYPNGVGVNVPFAQAIANSITRDKAYQGMYGTLTSVAAGAAAVMTGGVALLPDAAAAVTAAIKTCVANPVLCANQAGIAIGEIAAGGAMPAGTGAAVATAAVGSRVDDEVAALKGIAQSPAGSNLTGKAPGTVLQLQSQSKIEDLAAQYNNAALQPRDFQLDFGGDCESRSRREYRCASIWRSHDV